MNNLITEVTYRTSIPAMKFLECSENETEITVSGESGVLYTEGTKLFSGTTIEGIESGQVRIMRVIRLSAPVVPAFIPETAAIVFKMGDTSYIREVRIFKKETSEIFALTELQWEIKYPKVYKSILPK